jgi:hypothetical protein
MIVKKNGRHFLIFFLIMICNFETQALSLRNTRPYILLNLEPRSADSYS